MCKIYCEYGKLLCLLMLMLIFPTEQLTRHFVPDLAISFFESFPAYIVKPQQCMVNSLMLCSFRHNNTYCQSVTLNHVLNCLESLDRSSQHDEDTSYFSYQFYQKISSSWRRNSILTNCHSNYSADPSTLSNFQTYEDNLTRLNLYEPLTTQVLLYSFLMDYLIRQMDLIHQFFVKILY